MHFLRYYHHLIIQRNYCLSLRLSGPLSGSWLCALIAVCKEKVVGHFNCANVKLVGETRISIVLQLDCLQKVRDEVKQAIEGFCGEVGVEVGEVESVV